MRIGAHTRRLVFLYRALGWRALLVRVSRRAAATIFCRRTEFVLMKRLDDAGVRPHGDNELCVVAITTAHGAVLRRFNERYRDPHRTAAVAAYLRNGYDGFLVYRGDAAIGYWWWVSNRIDPALTHPCVERFEIALRDDEVFAFDYFIVPEYRDRGAALKALSSIYEALAHRGYRAVWGSVDSDNVQARWVYKLHGNDLVRRTVGYEVLWWLRVQGRRVFVRNTRWNATHPFERRRLFGHGPARSQERLSTHGV